MGQGVLGRVQAVYGVELARLHIAKVLDHVAQLLVAQGDALQAVFAIAGLHLGDAAGQLAVLAVKVGGLALEGQHAADRDVALAVEPLDRGQLLPDQGALLLHRGALSLQAIDGAVVLGGALAIDADLLVQCGVTHPKGVDFAGHGGGHRGI